MWTMRLVLGMPRWKARLQPGVDSQVLGQISTVSLIMVAILATHAAISAAKSAIDRGTVV
jgi:hypothetical protein